MMFFKNILTMVLVSAFVFASSAYAGKVELSTYYPAPYGEYTELKSTGNTSFATTSGSVTIGDGAGGSTNPGTLNLTPTSGAQSGGVEGSLRYDSGNHEFVYNNGSAWVSAGGGAGGAPSDWTCTTVSATGTGEASVSCPADHKVITGGCWTALWSTFTPYGAPTSTGWACTGYPSAQVEARCYCCQ